MSANPDKPRLSRPHALELLKQMIRIRRFEDKCAELYTQEKIRGFMHLYDGEEAVARWTEYDSLYGSRHLAEKWAADGTLGRIRALINVDMIGDRDLGNRLELG